MLPAVLEVEWEVRDHASFLRKRGVKMGQIGTVGTKAPKRCNENEMHTMNLGLDIPRTQRLLRLKPQLRPQKLLQQQRRTPRLRLVEGPR